MNPLPVDIAFVQTDSDTFRSTENVFDTPSSKYLQSSPILIRPLMKTKCDDFWGFLVREGINPDAHKRPREVPSGDLPEKNDPAAYIDFEGHAVIDASIFEQLKAKNYAVKVTYLPVVRNPEISNDDRQASYAEGKMPTRRYPEVSNNSTGECLPH